MRISQARRFGSSFSGVFGERATFSQGQQWVMMGGTKSYYLTAWKGGLMGGWMDQSIYSRFFNKLARRTVPSTIKGEKED
jgi:hypothetical protein